MTKYLLLLLTPLIGIFTGRVLGKFRHTVPEGYVAIKRRMGRICYKQGQPVIYRGGYVWCMPAVHSLEMYHESNNPLEVRPQVLLLQEGFFSVSALVTFGVSDMRTAAINDTAHVKRIVEEMAEAVILETLRNRHLRQLPTLQRKLAEQLDSAVGGLGVTITKFRPRAVPTRQTEDAQIMPVRANYLKYALGSLDIKVESLNPAVLIAAIANQPVTQAMPVETAETERPSAETDDQGLLGSVLPLQIAQKP